MQECFVRPGDCRSLEYIERAWDDAKYGRPHPEPAPLLRHHDQVSDHPLRKVGLRYAFASLLLANRVLAASHSSFPPTRTAIAPNSIHSTNGTATLKFEHAGSPPLQARIQSR